MRRARQNKIDPSDFAGTTITLTNPGTVGTVSSNPRLMLGQGAIIATGAISYPAEFHAMSASTIADLGISKVMTITSTYDHRIIQGAESGLFLKRVHELLLGAEGFYEEVFDHIRMPVKPAKWEADKDVQTSRGISDLDQIEKQARFLQLINMFRVRGHLLANLDPLTHAVPYHPELDSATYGFTVWDFDRTFITGGLGGLRTAKLKDTLEILHQTYCDKIGVEYRHIQSPEEKAWLQERMESTRNLPSFDRETRVHTLKNLIKAEKFEKYVHTKFVGHKRFSLEGSETLIPILDYLLHLCADDKVQEVVLGMAHRGRLNVLANIIGKPYRKIFSEFEGRIDPNSSQGSGDVKYHLGATGQFQTRNQKPVKVSVSPNPSHLEWVNPVVEGVVRAKQTHMPGQFNKNVMAVLIHGDAAFAGQGVVAETLNLSQLRGYKTRGTIHVIVNNQIGFTTTPDEARSSTYASDVAKMIQAPIFHVNGDDPEAALWVTQLAFEYRQLFEKDVVIDVFGYRRHGHNEGDEPGYTQPLMYKTIKEHPSVKTLYAKRLVTEKIMGDEEIEAMEGEVKAFMDQAFEASKSATEVLEPETPLAITLEQVQAVVPTHETRISEDLLRRVVEGCTRIPESFSIHPKLKAFIEHRKNLLTDDTASVDWAYGEALAFGSLLLEGTPIRLSGEDVSRGTFSQRHLVLTDINTGNEYLPLNHMESDQATMESVDSLLSEAAVLGFEFGYSIADPLSLVLWEAQFGDFANVAQPMIDNFIVSSAAKWQLHSQLVMLLPHGHEGQGPEHSSARLERFLTLCGEENMIVCNLTTPAQYFHALRRQIKGATGKPLVIMTPKSLLRMPEARSRRIDFTEGKFEEIIDDTSADKSLVRKVVLCSGKVYYDVLKYASEKGVKDVALVRLEQFYPFAEKRMKTVLASYAKATQVCWLQEEPKNMGAWRFLESRLKESLSTDQQLSYAGRSDSASPAPGSLSVHQRGQEGIIREALG